MKNIQQIKYFNSPSDHHTRRGSYGDLIQKNYIKEYLLLTAAAGCTHCYVAVVARRQRYAVARSQRYAVARSHSYAVACSQRAEKKSGGEKFAMALQ